MGYPLWDMLDDLAIARGLQGAQADSDRGYLRGRIAAVVWIPGLAIALVVGGFNNSWMLGLAVIVLTLIVMALIAFGPRRVLRRIRRPFAALGRR